MPLPLTSTLRIAVPQDASRLAHMHLTAWRETYAQRLPPSVIEGRAIADRVTRWETMLHRRDLPGAEAVFLIEQGPDIVGFTGCGRQSSDALNEQGYGGEIGSLYVLARAQGQGIGRLLWKTANRHLTALGFSGASLWVLKENQKARAFYEHQGAQVIAEQQETRQGVILNDIGYGWPLRCALPARRPR